MHLPCSRDACCVELCPWLLFLVAFHSEYQMVHRALSFLETFLMKLAPRAYLDYQPGKMWHGSDKLTSNMQPKNLLLFPLTQTMPLPSGAFGSVLIELRFWGGGAPFFSSISRARADVTERAACCFNVLDMSAPLARIWPILSLCVQPLGL